MTYAISAALQEAVYAALAADAALAALVGAAIHDATPEGPVPELYVTLGEETVRDRSAASARMAEHRLTVSVVTTLESFARAKAAAAAVTGALDGADLALGRGRLTCLAFESARARRTRGDEVRRIDLRFLARVEDI